MNKDFASNTAQRSNMCVKCSQKYFAVRFFIPPSPGLYTVAYSPKTNPEIIFLNI